jgi:8-oxo-dGTP diphosphatase
MKKYCYDYPMMSVTTDCIVIKNNGKTPKVLLIQRKHEPYINKWALPGGFVEIDEDLEEGAQRELEEETGIKGLNLVQFRTYGKPGRDPRGRTISVVYFANLDNEVTVTASDDAAEAAWFDLNDLPALAFDHEDILSDFKMNGPIKREANNISS